MRAVVDLLYVAAYPCNLSQHAVMDVFHHLRRDNPTCYAGLVGADDNAVTGTRELRNGFFRAR